MKKRKIEKNTQLEESEPGKKAENREKKPARGKQAGEKVEKRGKNPAEGKQAGQKIKKTQKTPSRRKASRMKKMHKYPQGNQYKIRK